MSYVYIPIEIARKAASISSADRESIERIKESKEIDDKLAYTMAIHTASNPEIVSHNKTELQNAKEQVFNSWDVIIAVIALCENIEQVEYIQKLGTLLGKLKKKPIKLNEVQLRPRLRDTFARIAIEHKLHRADDRILLRKKINATISIINDLLSRRSNDFQEA